MFPNFFFFFFFAIVYLEPGLMAIAHIHEILGSFKGCPTFCQIKRKKGLI